MTGFLVMEEKWNIYLLSTNILYFKKNKNTPQMLQGGNILIFTF